MNRSQQNADIDQGQVTATTSPSSAQVTPVENVRPLSNISKVRSTLRPTHAEQKNINTQTVISTLIIEARKIIGEVPADTPSDFDVIYGREARSLRAQLHAYKHSELRHQIEIWKGNPLAAWELPLGKIMIGLGTFGAVGLISNLSLGSGSEVLALIQNLGIAGIMGAIALRSYYYNKTKETPFFEGLLKRGQDNLMNEDLRELIGIETDRATMPKLLLENPQLRSILERSLQHGDTSLIKNKDNEIKLTLNSLAEADSSINPQDPDLIEAAEYVYDSRNI